ncbi:MAG: DNA/RNA nuclease SfsA [Cyanobacteria bacterium P01_D01_bin.105]
MSISASEWFYPYPDLIPGVLIKRYKRFLADIELESGDVITAHCPNTGPMTGVCHIGNPVMVSRSDNPKRKLAYTWELIAVESALADGEQVWVGINTAMPNRVVKSALQSHLFPTLGAYDTIRSEVPYGEGAFSPKKSSKAGSKGKSAAQTTTKTKRSRIDFLLSGTPDEKPIYLEVKNTTWTCGRRALFPDCVTTRGQKHLKELIALAKTARPVMVYFINRGDCDEFSPGDHADPTYGKLLRQAAAAGVEILPCRFQIQPSGIKYLGLANPILNDVGTDKPCEI